MAGKPLELPIPYKRTTEGNEIWHYGGGKIAYDSLQDAYDNVDPAVRAGKTVGIIENGKVVEYIWHPDNLSNAGLVKKTSGASVTGSPNKIVKIGADGESLEEANLEDNGSQLKTSYNKFQIGHATFNTGPVPSVNPTFYAFRPSLQSGETIAFLSDIITPVDTSNLTEYTADTNYTKDENIFFTIDDEIFFYRVLQDFTSLDPVDIEAEITAGNLEKITEGKFIKVLDHDSTTKTIYTKDSVVKDPSSKVLYRAKQDADETIPLTDDAYWENITNSIEDIANTADPIITNDITTDIFTVAYLSSHVDYVDFKPGKWVENINQLAQKTIQGWAIFNKKNIVEAEIDLDDTTIYDSGTGILDLSNVNTATDFVLTTATATTEFTINKVLGTISENIYSIGMQAGIKGIFTHTPMGSIGSGDIYIKKQSDLTITGSSVNRDLLVLRNSNDSLYQQNEDTNLIWEIIYDDTANIDILDSHHRKMIKREILADSTITLETYANVAYQEGFYFRVQKLKDFKTQIVFPVGVTVEGVVNVDGEYVIELVGGVVEVAMVEPDVWEITGNLEV